MIGKRGLGMTGKRGLEMTEKAVTPNEVRGLFCYPNFQIECW